MGIINILDKHVAELIAAGEVVERPSSVIKELAENAIDAKAGNITVEIKNGGTTFMRVTDDGCGIRRDDIRNAFLRHATSKVKDESDLNGISTLGFRGEALASISAVSRLQLITRNRDDKSGSCYEIHGGDEVSFELAGCPVGTTFVVRDLFYNIPARAKFLKKDVSEGNSVSNVIDKIALSHPEIAFTYIRDGKQVLRTSGDGKLISAIYSVFGRDFAKGLIPVEYKLGAVGVYGYISKPRHSRANRNMQNFFINGRYVKTRTAMYALEEAFKGSIMVGKFPSCVLNIDVPYEMIDVNVHPSKIEVRFINERPVFDAVYHSVKTSLMKNDDRKQFDFGKKSAFTEVKDSAKFNPFKNAPAIIGKNNPDAAGAASKDKSFKLQDEYDPFFPQAGRLKNTETPLSEAPMNKAETSKAFENTGIDSLKVSDSASPFDIIYKSSSIFNSQKEKSAIHEKNSNNPQKYKSGSLSETGNITDERYFTDSESSGESDNVSIKPLIDEKEDDIRYIGEAFSTYIIVEKNNDEILFVDKHAAHERIIYEKLKKEKSGADAQLLLQPITVSLDKKEYVSAIENLDMFSECSFEVEDFGNNCVIVRSAPRYIDASQIEDCITEMADYISKGKNDIFTEKMDWFYHNVACRSAIKAGNKSTPDELMDIVRQVEQNPNLRYCPHGRPVCIIMKKSEIEKQFGRM